MAGLRALTEEQKHQAFLKAKEEVKLDEGKLMRITEEHYEKALDFLRDYYITDEPLHKAAGALWGKEAREMHMEPLRQNISVMIVKGEGDKEGEIMALLTNQVVQKGELHGMGELEDVGLRLVWKYVNACENNAKLFDHFNIQEAVQLVSLVTNPKYRRRGLGTKVVKASMAMIRNFGVGKICVKGEGSSLFTQKIFEREGMTCLYKGIYREHEVGGKKVFEGTGIHDSINLYGMMMET